jgi:hypothetical protein
MPMSHRLPQALVSEKYSRMKRDFSLLKALSSVCPPGTGIHNG